MYAVGAGPHQSSSPRILVPQDSVFPDSRLPQPGGPGPPMYIPQEPSYTFIPLYPQAVGSLFLVVSDSQGTVEVFDPVKFYLKYIYTYIYIYNLTPWFESASELYRPSDRRLSAKWLPTCADSGCHVVSLTDPSGRILGFLDRSRYFSIK
jgi:hypothetical protein